MTEVQQHTMSRTDAERLTERIRHTATTFMETRDRLTALVREAQEGQAHVALGYRSWTEYIAEVFSDTPLMRLTRDERKVLVSDLSAQGMSTRAIAPVVGASIGTVHADRAEVFRTEQASRRDTPAGATPSTATPDLIRDPTATEAIRRVMGRMEIEEVAA